MKSRFIKFVAGSFALAFATVAFMSCSSNNTSKTSKTQSGSSEKPNEPITDTVTISADLADDFSVSTVFTDNMVIQRNEKFRVFGFAEQSQNGKKVVADFLNMHSEGLIQNGEWQIVFPHGIEENLNANVLEVKSNTKTFSFKNLLVGDVYMVIGQSNVAYSVQQHWDYLDTLPLTTAKLKGHSSVLDKNAPIRINYNGLDQNTDNYTRGSDAVVKQPSSPAYKGWQTPTLDNIKNFSALGYYFAYNFINRTNSKIPIGLIEINGNGLPIGTFLPNNVADRTGSDSLDKSKGYYVTSGANGEVPARYMYNEYIYPFEKFSIAGVIWYQGESDLYKAQMDEYSTRFRQLINYMRSTHNISNPGFPVYMVEFPSIYQKHAEYHGVDNWTYLDTGKIRAVIGAIPMTLKNSYFSVSSDLWSDDTYWNNLHPNCKFEQGERLAKLVSAVNGDFGTLDQATGPILSSVEYSGDKKSAVLTFKNVGEGLTTFDKSTTVKGFTALSDLNNPSYSCTATITGKTTIKITCEYEMKGISYNSASSDFYGKEITLCDSFNNPAGAFMVNN